MLLTGEDGAPDGAGDSGVGRARRLTDDDLEELKGWRGSGVRFAAADPPFPRAGSSRLHHNNGAAPMELRTAAVTPTSSRQNLRTDAGRCDLACSPFPQRHLQSRLYISRQRAAVSSGILCFQIWFGPQPWLLPVDCACLIRSFLCSLFPLAGLIPSFCSPRTLLDFSFSKVLCVYKLIELDP